MNTIHYVGDLTILADNAQEYTRLETVSGYLCVYADLQAPNLTTVGGCLDVRADLQAPNLTTVGGCLDVYDDLQAPNLTTVGGCLDVYDDLQAPSLLSVQGETLSKPPAYVRSERWPICITDNYLRIGCQRHTHQQWSKLSNRKIDLMDAEALTFWMNNKVKLLDLCAKQAV